MNKLAKIILQVILAIPLIVFGLNAFIGFIAIQPMPGGAGALASALFAAGYFFPLNGIVMLVTGLLLISNRFVPLALVLLAPLNVHIFLFHLFLAPQLAGFILPIIMMIIQVVLMVGYKKAYAPLFRSKA